MSGQADISSHLPAPMYARFSRRVRGMFFDWLLAVAVGFGALFVSISVENNQFSRVLGCLIVGLFLLYEPILVSATGGTLGHHLTNLRVVDDRSHGNVGFFKATVRSVLKALLGWYSFLVILATRKNQALHDLLTKSTVQIRDQTAACPASMSTNAWNC